jgi:tripartite-type tricarboxylate transporter receptor subunit TctC
VARSPDLIKRGETDGTKLIGSTPAAFTKHIGAELVRWQKVVREASIKLEEN